MPIGDLAGEITVVLGAATIVIFALFAGRRLQWIGAPLGLLTCALAGTLIAVRLATQAQALTWNDAWSLDRAAGWAELIILVVAAVTIALSPDWFRTDARHGEWYALVLLSAAGAMVMASAADALELLLGVLLSSATGYVLAAYHRRSGLAVEAGAKYFLVGALTNTLLLAGIVVFFGAAGTTVYVDATAPLATASTTALAAALVLMVVGLAFKLGAFPAHTWMPDVAQGAPAPAAAFLTVAPKVGAIVALGRIATVLPETTIGWRPLIAVLAAVTMTVGNLSALWQDDVRRLLGWSSVSQAGYALMAIPVLGRSDDAVSALVFFIATYAIGQLAAFAVVTHLRGRTAVADYRGLAAERPWPAVAMTVAMLSFVGIPPLAGFTGKLLLFTATIDGGYAWLAAVAVVNTVISLFYYLRVIVPMTLDAPDPSVRTSPVAVLGRWSATTTAATATGVVALGLVAQPVLHALEGARLLP